MRQHPGLKCFKNSRHLDASTRVGLFSQVGVEIPSRAALFPVEQRFSA